MVRWKWVAFWVFLFTIWYCWPTEGQENAITLRIYPRLVVAGIKGAYVRIQSRVPRHKANRIWTLNVWTDGPGPWEYRQNQVDGEQDQTIFPVCTADNYRPCHILVYPGNYRFSACVHRVQEKTDKLKAICDHLEMEVK